MIYHLCVRKLSNSRASAKVTRWSKEGNFFFADPANWNGSSIAAPHLERVPCRQDDVILPSASLTLSVLLPVREIEVRSIRLSNEVEPFTKWEWESFQDRREFSRGRFTVKYAGDDIRDFAAVNPSAARTNVPDEKSFSRYAEYSCANCFCQENSQSDYLEEICAIQRPRCGFTGCEYPLTVESIIHIMREKIN